MGPKGEPHSLAGEGGGPNSDEGTGTLLLLYLSTDISLSRSCNRTARRSPPDIDTTVLCVLYIQFIRSALETFENAVLVFWLKEPLI